MLENLDSSDPADPNNFTYNGHSESWQVTLEHEGQFEISLSDLPSAAPASFTGFTLLRIGEPVQQDNSHYAIPLYYTRNVYTLKLHGFSWSAMDYLPNGATWDCDAQGSYAVPNDGSISNVVATFRFGESLMPLRSLNPLQKTWSLTQPQRTNGQINAYVPTSQSQAIFPTVMPDPAQYYAAAGISAYDPAVLEFWDYMSAFPLGTKSSSERRVYVLLEDVDSTDASQSGNYDAEITGDSQFYKVTLMTGQDAEAYAAYTAEERPGFSLNTALTSSDWQPDPATGGTTSMIVIYYQRITVLVDFYLDGLEDPTTVAGRYGSSLFSGNPDGLAELRTPAADEGQEFLGWYTNPDGMGGLRVDDPDSLAYLGSFPTGNLSLYAHWSTPTPPEDPEDPEDPDDGNDDSDNGGDDNGGNDNNTSPTDNNSTDPDAGNSNNWTTSSQPLSTDGDVGSDDTEQAQAADASQQQSANDSEIVSIPDTQTPETFSLEAPLVTDLGKHAWAGANLVLLALNALPALWVVLRSFLGRAANRPKGRQILWTIASAALATVALLYFMATQSLNAAPVLVDAQTPTMLALMLAQAVLILGARLYRQYYQHLLAGGAEGDIDGVSLRSRIRQRYGRN
jgi:hypothetical protein